MVLPRRGLRGVALAALIVLTGSRPIGSQTEATDAVKAIWGASGVARKSGQNYQIGCIPTGGALVIVSTSKISFDDALSRVNLQTNGTHIVTAEVYDVDGNIAVSSPVPVTLCNP